MRWPRFSIAWSMAAVAVVALDTALGRFLYSENPELLIGVALPALALQWATISAFRRRGSFRAFWIGYAAFGLIITTSYLWAMLFPESIGLTRTGTLVRAPGSPLYPIWSQFGERAFEWLLPILIQRSSPPDPYSLMMVSIRALIWSTPQFLVAVMGGLGTSLLIQVPGFRRRPQPTEPTFAAQPPLLASRINSL